MTIFTRRNDGTRFDRERRKSCRQFCAARVKSLHLALLSLTLLSATLMLSSCGSSSSGSSQNSGMIAGNWQYTMAPPPDGSFLGGLQGGFLLQTNGSVTGSSTYAVSLPLLPYPCNSGAAAITGTVSGQNVALTAVAGSQTFTLGGTLSFDGSTMVGTYKSTAGTASDGTPCGSAQTGLQWSALLVPPITGTIQGSFHSSGGIAGLDEQVFLVSGGLLQAANTGASNASVTGNLTFLNPTTNLSDYPCFTSASVSGQISGNILNLQILAADGSTWGEIGELPGSNGVTGVNAVAVALVAGGAMISGSGPTYIVGTNSCPQSSGSTLSVGNAGDYGNICLALGSASACQQPITLVPSALAFPSQVLGSPSTMQTVTLTNASSALLGGLTLTLANNSGAANFAETDACGVNGIPSMGQPFDLVAGQSCLITITFAPLETCAVGTPPAQCPSPLTATLTVISANNDMIFTLPITGSGESAGAGIARTIEPGADGIIFGDVERHAEIR
jgi:hypothetical protein